MSNPSLLVLSVQVVLLSQCCIHLVQNLDPLEKEYGKIEKACIIFRHGDRSPLLSYPNDPHKNYPWPAGFGQILNKGEQRLYALGKWFRERYDNFKIYKCEIQTGYSVLNRLNRTINVDKCPPNDLPIKFFPDPYVLKYWVKTLVAEEGSNIILKCVYDEHQFPDYKTWYKGENEMVKFSERVSLNLDNVLSIKNLNLNDISVYRCVSPDNEFSTNVVVVRSCKQKPRKKIMN